MTIGNYYAENLEDFSYPSNDLNLKLSKNVLFELFCAISSQFPPPKKLPPQVCLVSRASSSGQNINSGRGIVHCERLGRDMTPQVM